MNHRIAKVIKMLAWIATLLLIGLVSVVLRMSFNSSDEKVERAFDKKGVPIHIGRYQHEGTSMRYMKTGHMDAKTAILFIHGAPGAMDMFSKVMMDSSLRAEYALYSVDRLGYGDSDYGRATTSLQHQADAISTMISDEISQEDVVLFAHSFGAPIAALIGRDKAKVSKVILAGGAVSPDHEPYEWAARLANSWLIRWAASPDLRISSDEKLAHVRELQKIAHIWVDYPKTVVVMHGTKDHIVPYANLLYLADRLPDDRFVDGTLEGQNHFFVLDAPLMRAILKGDNGVFNR